MSSRSAPSRSVSSVPPEYEEAVREIAPLWLDLTEEEVDVIASSSRVASISHILETLSNYRGTLRPTDPPREPGADPDVRPEDQRAYQEFNRAHRDLLESLRAVSESILGREISIRSSKEMARKAFEGVEITVEDSNSDQGGER
jgi:hypothetical protein